ncbi:cobalamin biosynthesis protein CbiB [Actinomyces sp. oral taxon 448 str. F0400]|nr:cobalamin biosynthesis protein CbiB [Actinomyces sp. oral taxon 448 str. F0400]
MGEAAEGVSAPLGEGEAGDWLTGSAGASSAESGGSAVDRSAGGTTAAAEAGDSSVKADSAGVAVAGLTGDSSSVEAWRASADGWRVPVAGP